MNYDCWYLLFSTNGKTYLVFISSSVWFSSIGTSVEYLASRSDQSGH